VFKNAYLRARGWKGDLEPYDVARTLLNANLNVLYGIANLNFYSRLFPEWMVEASDLFFLAPHAERFPPGGLNRVADLLNVRYILHPSGPVYDLNRKTKRPTPAAAQLEENPVLGEFPGDLVLRGVVLKNGEWGFSARGTYTIKLRKNEDAFPRAFLVPYDRVNKPAQTRAAEAVAARRLLTSSEFDPRLEVLLAADPGSDRLGPAEGGRQIEVPVEFVSYEPHMVRLKVDAPRAAWLFLSDTYYPGWTAEVNGEEVEIYRANVVGRAVRLSRGPAEIVFQYSPSSLRMGVILAVLGAILVTTLGIQRRLLSRTGQ
jgi:hypothetical protein